MLSNHISDKARQRLIRKEGVALQAQLTQNLQHVNPLIRQPVLAAAQRRINRGDSLAALSFLLASDSAHHVTVLSDLGRFIAAIEAAMQIPQEQSVYAKPEWRLPIVEIDILVPTVAAKFYIEDQHEIITHDQMLAFEFSKYGMALAQKLDGRIHPMLQRFMPMLLDIVYNQARYGKGEVRGHLPYNVAVPKQRDGDDYTVYVHTDGERVVRIRYNTKVLVKVTQDFMAWENTEVPESAET